MEGRLTLVKLASLFVSWLVDPFVATHRMSLEWAERTLFSGELEEVGGRVCARVCVRVCAFERACILGLPNQPSVQLSHRYCQPDDGSPPVCAERLQI